MPRTPLIVAPADEQSVVKPFLLRSRPRWGSRAPPLLSERPMPPGQAEVTMLLPAVPPQSPALPTKIQGLALRLSAWALWAGLTPEALRTTTAPRRTSPPGVKTALR